MFSSKLKQLRESRGWTKSRLAQKANISQTYAGELEAGIKQPTIRTLEKIAAAFGLTVSELLEEEPKKAG